MKIAFDENVPMGMVRVFQSLANERALHRQMGGFTVVSAQDYKPKPDDPDYVRKSDIPWLTRYAKDGGKVVVSGDCGMVEKPHELLAIRQHGFVLVLFERSWSNWDFFKKSSLLLHYWIVLAKRVKASKRGAMWRIPGQWRDDEDLRRITVKQDKLFKGPPSVTVRKVRASGKGRGVRSGRSGVSKEPEAANPATAAEGPRQGQLDLVQPQKVDEEEPAK